MSATTTLVKSPPTREERLRQHRADVKKIRDDRDRRIREQRDRWAVSKDDWVFESSLRRELEIEKQLAADAVTVESQRGLVDFKTFLQPHAELSPQDATFIEMDRAETAGIHKDDPEVRTLREFCLRVAHEHAIDVRVSRLPQVQNGSAVRALKRIDIAPIQSLSTATTTLHELGHILSADVPADAPSKPGAFALGRICVSAEVLAWRWVLEHTPIWNREMHAVMTSAITTYRPHATTAEGLAIDELVSPLSLCQARLRTAREGC